jgi:hypothetical protein
MTARWTILGLLLLMTAACAQPARTSNMIAYPTEAAFEAVPDDLKGSLVLGEVTGGQETDPLWQSEVGNPEFREALTVSLQAHRLAGSATDAPYELDAQLIELEQPLGGFDLTVTATARYVVESRTDGTTAFDETITTPFTADFSSSFMAIERLRLANEGAARSNITQFIRRYLEVMSAP